MLALGSMGPLLDNIPEGFGTVLGTQQVSWTCSLGLWDCKKSLALESGILGFERPAGQLSFVTLGRSVPFSEPQIHFL